MKNTSRKVKLNSKLKTKEGIGVSKEFRLYLQKKRFEEVLFCCFWIVSYCKLHFEIFKETDLLHFVEMFEFSIWKKIGPGLSCWSRFYSFLLEKSRITSFKSFILWGNKYVDMKYDSKVIGTLSSAPGSSRIMDPWNCWHLSSFWIYIWQTMDTAIALCIFVQFLYALATGIAKVKWSC